MQIEDRVIVIDELSDYYGYVGNIRAFIDDNFVKVRFVGHRQGTVVFHISALRLSTYI